MPSLEPPPIAATASVIGLFSLASSHTALNYTVDLQEQELPKVLQESAPSEILATFKDFEPIRKAFLKLVHVEAGWDSYDAPAPSERSLTMGTKVLAALQNRALLPDQVAPSAEGGVAFVFVGEDGNRAVIEDLNENEDFILLYDRRGNSKTLLWEQRIPEDHFRQLKDHLRGVRLASKR